MQRLGFSARWRDWISLLLSSATSAVLLNGTEGKPVRHRRGLRQGDPLSPLLFILALDPLQKILQAATNAGILSRLPIREAKLRTSLYADDAVLFLNPIRAEVDTVLRILHAFGQATGLRINVDKSSVTPIRCDDIDLDDVLSSFSGERTSFPIRYLGMPLSLGRLRMVHLQHVLDRARSHLASWKGRWINAGGRQALASSVLSAIPIFAMTALKLPPKFIHEFDRIRRNFLWDIDEETNPRGKCKVRWLTVCSPKEVGGLGLPNLKLFCRALRLRWLWHEWSEPTRPWVGTPTPCDAKDQDFFHEATRVTIGDGKRALFWHSSWHGDTPLRIQFQQIYARSRRKNKTVAATILNDSWVADLGQNFPATLLTQFVDLWRLAQSLVLSPGTPDSIRWILTADGVYSSASAYRLLFEGRTLSPAPEMIWSPWAPAKCKFFLWLLLHNRLWCADRLQRRRLPNAYFCPLCLRSLETSQHLFFECPFTKRIWAAVATWTHCSSLAPPCWEAATTPQDIWQLLMQRSAAAHKEGLSSLFTLVCWNVWRERNARIFRQKSATFQLIIAWIRDEAREWSFANAKALRKLLFEPP
ncbi:hypothetical protein ACQ4PT_010999 [Festuca glaucescens]